MGKTVEDVSIRQKKKSTLSVTMKRLFQNPTAIIGLVLLAALVIMALIGNFVAPYDFAEMNMKDKLQSPSMAHLFGTDQYGRDLFSRILVGAKYSLFLGFCNSAVSCIFGVTIGVLSAYFGGKVDLILMRILDIVQAIPGMLLAIVIAAVFGSGFWQIILAIGIAGTPVFTRMSRAAVMSVRNMEYIEASQLSNCSTARTILVHVLPNCLSALIVQFTMSIGSCILLAAGLSFIGLGIQEPTPEWGAMLSGAKDYLRGYTYMAISPGLFIALAVLGINLVGDGLRDVMDPKLRK